MQNIMKEKLKNTAPPMKKKKKKTEFSTNFNMHFNIGYGQDI